MRTSKAKLPGRPSMVMMDANKLLLALLVVTELCTFSAQPTSPSAAGMPSAVDPSTAQPATASTAAVPPSTAATASSQKFPQLPVPAEGGGAGAAYLPGAGGGAYVPPEGGGAGAGAYVPPEGGGAGPYLPGAEVASALPVPTPEEFPSAASLGFGGHGDECCGGNGGYGWFGGPGGYGPGTYGYNGPLYFGAAAATARGFGNVLLPLVLACVSMYHF